MGRIQDQSGEYSPAPSWDPWDEDALAFAAYLGTHRDRIVALLTAADALAEAAGKNDWADGRNMARALAAYEKAKGA